MVRPPVRLFMVLRQDPGTRDRDRDRDRDREKVRTQDARIRNRVTSFLTVPV